MRTPFIHNFFFKCIQNAHPENNTHQNCPKLTIGIDSMIINECLGKKKKKIVSANPTYPIFFAPTLNFLFKLEQIIVKGLEIKRKSSRKKMYYSIPFVFILLQKIARKLSERNIAFIYSCILVKQSS